MSVPTAGAVPPRVSVITTVFNGELYLDETIESIAGQTFRDFEYLIVDDGSTDSTPGILQRWAARDGRIRVLTNPENRGQAPSINRALAVACGEYVARCDADDVAEPWRLARQVAVLDDRPGLVLVSMNHRIMSSDGRLLRTTHNEASPEVVAFLLNFGNAVGGHSAVTFRREAALQAGGYDEGIAVGIDYDLWAKLSALGGLLVMREPGMRYRLHDRRLSVRFADRQRAIASRVTRRMLERTLGRTVDEREIDSVTSVWGNVPSSARVEPALAIFREAYAQFRRRDGTDGRHAVRVRREFAYRLTAMAVTLALRGRTGAALKLSAAAMRWSPPASLRRLARLARNGAVELWARLAGSRTSAAVA